MFYTEQRRIIAGECDVNGRLSAANLLRFFQKIAEDHLNEIGWTTEQMIEQGQVFLLNKISLDIRRLPAKGEAVTLWTAPTGIDRVRFLREFVMDGPGEERLVSARSWWLLVDSAKRRPLRPASFAGNLIYEETRVPGNRSIPEFPNIHGNAEEVTTVTIGYSRLDENGHMNNASYADLICDAVPIEDLLTKAVRGFSVGFHSEVKAGNRLMIERYPQGDGHYIRGRREDALCFEGLILLR